jgi:UDP-glucuronate 4-epimerase
MTRVVVTGSAGFIGSHLSERLLSAGYDLTGVDSFTDHYDRAVKELNLTGPREHEHFQFLEGDLAYLPLEEVFAGAEVVYHLAARPGVRDSWDNFADYVQENVVCTRGVFDAAAKVGVRVVYASSSSVYGNSTVLPVSEGQPLAPISPYGATKVLVEALAGAYAASYGLWAQGMRYFTVYGPRQRPDMGLSRFISAALAGEELKIYGDGLQRRDMTYVGDVVEATIAAANPELKSGGVYNVASDSPRTLLEILEELQEVLEEPVRLVHEKPKRGDVRDTWGAIDLAAAQLGYKPTMGLGEGLARQVAEERRRKVLR